MGKPKVVILCGGHGTRLREETEFKPKPLVEVGGMPILWHIMQHYASHGFTDFVLCLGEKGRMIKEFFMHYDWDARDFTLNTKTKEIEYHDGHGMEDWTITFADTGRETLTAGRISAIKQHIPADDEFFLLTYGDGVSDVDIAALVAHYKNNGKTVTFTGVHPVNKYGLVKLGNDSVDVLDFAEKPPMAEYINGGYMAVSRKIFDAITEDCMLESGILPKLAKRGEIAMYPHEGFWHSMDTYKDFKDLNALWDNGAPWKVWEHHPRRNA